MADSAELREALIRAQGRPLRQALERSMARLPAVLDESLRWKGAWDRERPYQPGDVVEHGGSSWRALIPNTDSEPPSPLWELVAKRGASGPSGVNGFDGPSGPQGPPGPGTPLVIEDEGVGQGIATTVDFVGAGVTATVAAGTATVTVPSSGGHVIEDEGVPLPQRADLDFTGAGVMAADAGGKTVITIPGGTVAFDDPVESQFGDPMSQGVDIDSARADHKHDRHDDAILFLTRMV